MSLADYDVVKPIGKGKFAVVYRAQRKSDGALVAIKKIAIDAMDQKARDKCLKEVRLLQSVHHANIIEYMDSFIEGDELIIVFEWAAAGDLKRQIRKAQERKARFDERVIWKYFAQICDAIAHMHEKRIMHRDLKPANVSGGGSMGGREGRERARGAPRGIARPTRRALAASHTRFRAPARVRRSSSR